MPSNRENGQGNLSCSFCGKGQKEVKKLIAGPSVYICDECISLCNDILAEEVQKDEQLDGPDREPRPPRPVAGGREAAGGEVSLAQIEHGRRGRDGVHGNLLTRR